MMTATTVTTMNEKLDMLLAGSKSGRGHNRPTASDARFKPSTQRPALSELLHTYSCIVLSLKFLGSLVRLPLSMLVDIDDSDLRETVTADAPTQGRHSPIPNCSGVAVQ